MNASGIRFARYHALGNDYIVVPAAPADAAVLARAICDRHRGVGGDGILVGPLDSVRADFRLRIINPDGGEAEKSGNGLRIFARYLFDRGLVTSSPFSLETPGGVVTAEVLGNEGLVVVEMGVVSFSSTAIPVAGGVREVIDEELELDDLKVRFSAATIGNPHCVVRWDAPDRATAIRLGPGIETHPLFPNRTNVQFMEVLDRANIRIEIWERGAGYTLASGSSSSAAAAVAHRLGLVDRRVTVHMPGGELGIELDEDFGVTMTGPATRICDGNYYPDY